MTSSPFSRPGAIDLSGLRRPVASATSPAGPANAGAYVIDINEQTFQRDALEASMDHVVVVSLWSPRAPASRTLNDTLSQIAAELSGQVLLALIDVDANPQIAAAIGAQGVPFVLGLLRGQPVPLFQGTVDEADARRYLDELLKVAAANGITGRVAPRSTAEPEPPVETDTTDDPRFAAADEALVTGDLDTAVATYQRLVDADPADTEAAERLAGVKLMRRTRDADSARARADASERPGDVAAQLLAADFDLLEDRIDEAFERLLAAVAQTTGEERDEVRRHLLELFAVVGADDERVATARRRLASALF
ncbi:MAG: co-chaperone YbbN [Nocardioidaceae bacterium]